MHKRTYLSFLIFLFIFLGIKVGGFCQPANPQIDPDVPITGIELLLGAGALLGAKKAYKTRKKNKSI